MPAGPAEELRRGVPVSVAALKGQLDDPGDAFTVSRAQLQLGAGLVAFAAKVGKSDVGL